MRRGAIPVSLLAVSLLAVTACARPAAAQSAAAVQSGDGARPVVVVQTSKGAFEFELYPEDAPRSVEHIVALVKRGFYDGMRVHRVEADFVVQFGDPYSRDLQRKSQWGRGGSGRAIGVAEISPKHTHRVGAVGLAYANHPSTADSQLYIILADTERSRKLNGEYAIVGQVTSGMEVVQRIEVLDTIEKVTLKAEGRDSQRILEGTEGTDLHGR